MSIQMALLDVYTLPLYFFLVKFFSWYRFIIFQTIELKLYCVERGAHHRHAKYILKYFLKSYIFTFASLRRFISRIINGKDLT